MKFAKARYIPAFLTIALLLGVSAETYSRPRPGDADPFHARVKVAEAGFVTPAGWTPSDLKIPDGAMTLLKPNVGVCRQYRTPSCLFQFLFDGAVPENVRREIFTKLIGQNMKLLTVLERSDEPGTSNQIR